jgi:hypothetical protein
MRLGTAIHCAILEPDRYADEYLVPDPPVDPSSLHHLKRKAARRHGAGESKTVISDEIGVSEGKVGEYLERDDVQKLADYYREHPPSETPDLTGGQLKTVQSVKRAVEAHPKVRGGLLDGGDAEVSFFWNVATEYGQTLPCKGRADYLVDLGGAWMVIDLKTTSRGVGAGSYDRTVGRSNYHLQARHYADGLEAATGKSVAHFIHLAVETDAPHKVRAHRMGPADYADNPDAAATLWQGAKERLEDAYAAIALHRTDPDAYVGLDPSFNELELKPWEI